TDKFTASRVFTINPAAKDGSPLQISTKTFHVGHNRWETSAPLRVLMPYSEGGKNSVVGSFTCTPVVRYDLTTLFLPPSEYGISTRRGALVSHLLWPTWKVLVLIWRGEPSLA